MDNRIAIANSDSNGISTNAGYDLNALAVGQAVLRDTSAETVILLGSRARGDYREDSDIDLLVVHASWLDSEIRDKARCAANAMVEDLYGKWMPVDFIWFTPEEFEHRRRSINSVAAIATEEGVTMSGQPAEDEYRNDDDYSNEWTVTEQRCGHTRAHLRVLRRSIEAEEISLMIGQQAHQVLEHAMKALISAKGRRYPHHHNLEDLERDMRRVDPEFTNLLESPLKALNDYSGRLKYNEPYAPLGDRSEILRRVRSDVELMFQHVAALTGRDPWLEQPESE